MVGKEIEPMLNKENNQQNQKFKKPGTKALSGFMGNKSNKRGALSQS